MSLFLHKGLEQFVPHSPGCSHKALMPTGYEAPTNASWGRRSQGASAPLAAPPPAQSPVLSPFQPCQPQVSLPEHARDNIHVYGLCPVLTSLGPFPSTAACGTRWCSCWDQWPLPQGRDPHCSAWSSTHSRWQLVRHLRDQRELNVPWQLAAVSRKTNWLVLFLVSLLYSRLMQPAGFVCLALCLCLRPLLPPTSKSSASFSHAWQMPGAPWNTEFPQVPSK